MKLEEIGELGFINNLEKKYKSDNAEILKGIGDDTAVFLNENEYAILLTTDMLIENIHFRISDISPVDLGFKSLAVNLSDIAAMGGIPKNVFLSLGIPEKISYEFLTEFYNGMEDLKKKYNLNIIGGDTNSSRNDFIINIVVTGIIKKDEIIYRDGAKIKDKIFVTGYLGDSACGLDVLFGKLNLDENHKNYFQNTHIKPNPQIKEGNVIANSKLANSMIDLSDGLAADLRNICNQSRVGAVIYENQIPYSGYMKDISHLENVNSLEYALYGGEDYSLLFTVSPENKTKLSKIYNSEIQTPLFEIGEIIEGKDMEIILKTNKREKIAKTGFQHF
ncbi:thiamine-phosphate kinase [candidate division KSB1 bacterium]